MRKGVISQLALANITVKACVARLVTRPLRISHPRSRCDSHVVIAALSTTSTVTPQALQCYSAETASPVQGNRLRGILPSRTAAPT